MLPVCAIECILIFHGRISCRPSVLGYTASFCSSRRARETDMTAVLEVTYTYSSRQVTKANTIRLRTSLRSSAKAKIKDRKEGNEHKIHTLNTASATKTQHLRKLSYRKDDRAMRPMYMSALKIFDSP